MELTEFLPRVFDPYERPARLYPVLLALAPIPVTIVSMYGSDAIAKSAALSVLGLCGASYLLGRGARDAGVKVQDKLFMKWGGAPTTQLLRHRDKTFDVHTKARFHKFLAKGVGKSMPTRDAEDEDQEAADHLYRAAVVWLISKTRDRRAHDLVFKENVAYGFHRNALGMRKIGILVSLTCIVWILVRAGIFSGSSLNNSIEALMQLPSTSVGALSVASAFLLIWTSWITEGAVRRSGLAYAERLLQSCDRLATPRSTKAAEKV